MKWQTYDKPSVFLFLAYLMLSIWKKWALSAADGSDAFQSAAAALKRTSLPEVSHLKKVFTLVAKVNKASLNAGTCTLTKPSKLAKPLVRNNKQVAQVAAETTWRRNPTGPVRTYEEIHRSSGCCENLTPPWRWESQLTRRGDASGLTVGETLAETSQPWMAAPRECWKTRYNVSFSMPKFC